MKKSILNLGKSLTKLDQKKINGGMGTFCACSTRYRIEGIFTKPDGSIGYECSYNASGNLFPGARCLGVLQGSVCCPGF